MATTLYRKYRPSRWEEIAGQRHVKTTLAFEVATGKIAHAYIFSGPRGIGKTTVARIFSRSINCESESRGKGKGAGEPCGECGSCSLIADGRALDIIEMDAASHRGIDNVRDNIIENARFTPSKLKYKVFIIDEVHMLTTEAFNALLKTLEEPPEHAVFVLATTELHKVPPTIISRCQRFDFKKIPFSDLVDRLHDVCGKEGCKVDRKVLEEIARHSDGCLRDAEGLLGKVLTVGDGSRVSYDEALVVLPRSDFETVSSFTEALLRRDSRSALMTIGEVLEGGMDIDQFVGDVIELLRKVLLTRMSGTPEIVAHDLDEERRKRLAEWAELADVPTIVRATETLIEKRRDLKTSHPAQLPLELAAIRICERVDAAGMKRPEQKTDNSAEGSGKSGAAADISEERKEEVREEAKAEHEPVAAEVTDTKTKKELKPVTTVERLLEKWDDLVAKVGEEHASIPYILGSAKPIEVLGKKIRIGFEYAFHRDKVNQEKNRRLLEKAVEAVFGVKAGIEGVLLDKKEEMVHTEPADGEVKEKAPETESSASDALAAAFGGTVVE